MESTSLAIVSILMAGFIAAVAAFSASYGNATVLRQFIEGVSRQPEAKDTLLTNALICVGLIEALPIIAVVVALILLYANPLIK